ncbi:hypothetical protein QE152_g7501 [Popillia japonica]|uniref:Uncharacterized protein n=1 Tax=Popillia japonica TaxID=7064 RepID=A0AAW1MF05_POPJA
MEDDNYPNHHTAPQRVCRNSRVNNVKLKRLILTKDDPSSAYGTAKSQTPASVPRRNPKEGGKERVHKARKKAQTGRGSLLPAAKRKKQLY